MALLYLFTSSLSAANIGMDGFRERHLAKTDFVKIDGQVLTSVSTDVNNNLRHPNLFCLGTPVQVQTQSTKQK